VTKIPCCTGVIVSAGSGNMYRHMIMALFTYYEFEPLGCLFERILAAVPANSAPVERVF